MGLKTIGKDTWFNNLQKQINNKGTHSFVFLVGKITLQEVKDFILKHGYHYTMTKKNDIQYHITITKQIKTTQKPKQQTKPVKHIPMIQS